MEPTAVVQDIYAAFARGDVEAILGHLSDDVAWEPGMAEHGVPWLRPGHGRDAVRQFFRTVAEHLDFRVFEPAVVLTGDGHVAVVIDHEVAVRSTGAVIRDREIHLWTFDDTGRVTALRHFLDTHQHLLASGVGEAGQPAKAAARR
jgi:uncharacterized protein